MCSFKNGDILLESKPFATILTKENVDKRCEVCFCELDFVDNEKIYSSLQKPEIIQCNDCTNCYYCSVECLKEDIPIHKYECGLFSKNFPKFDATRMMIRLYIKLAHGNGWNEVVTLQNGKTRGFKDLLRYVKIQIYLICSYKNWFLWYFTLLVNEFLFILH